MHRVLSRNFIKYNKLKGNKLTSNQVLIEIISKAEAVQRL